MKKVVIVLIALLCVSGVTFAADATMPSGSLFQPKDLTVQVGLGSGFLIGGIDFYGGAEYGLGSFKVAEKIPLTYGAAVRVGYWGWSDSFLGYTDSYYDFGIGALGTLHLSWKDVLPDVKWLAKFESYIGLGLGRVRRDPATAAARAPRAGSTSSAWRRG